MICRALTRLCELQEIGQACFIGSLNHDDDEVTGGFVPSDFLVDDGCKQSDTGLTDRSVWLVSAGLCLPEFL